MELILFPPLCVLGLNPGHQSSGLSHSLKHRFLTQIKTLLFCDFNKRNSHTNTRDGSHYLLYHSKYLVNCAGVCKCECVGVGVFGKSGVQSRIMSFLRLIDKPRV